MSNWEDREAEVQQQQDVRSREKLEKEEQHKKDYIRDNFEDYLEETDTPRRKSEEDMVVDLALHLQEENVLAKKTIEDKYNLKIYEYLDDRIENTRCPDFFKKIDGIDNEGKAKKELDDHLRKTNISIKKSEEKKILELINERIKMREAQEEKQREMDKYNKYAEKIEESKFKEFLEKYLR